MGRPARECAGGARVSHAVRPPGDLPSRVASRVEADSEPGYRLWTGSDAQEVQSGCSQVSYGRAPALPTRSRVRQSTDAWMLKDVGSAPTCRCKVDKSR